MLDRDERTAINEALTAWAKLQPDEPLIGFLGSRSRWTPLELVDEVIGRTPDGEAFLEIVEHAVRREGLQKVTELLMRDQRRLILDR